MGCFWEEKGRTRNIGDYGVYLTGRVNVLRLLIHQAMIRIQVVDDDSCRIDVDWAGA
jgi:hypothetical protein